MENYHNRLNTYVNWPLSGTCSAEKMAKAGFYFLGRGDGVRCYFCAKDLENWEPDDDPFSSSCKFKSVVQLISLYSISVVALQNQSVEHRNHSSVCPFIRLSKELPSRISHFEALDLFAEKYRLEIERTRDRLKDDIMKRSVPVVKILKQKLIRTKKIKKC